MGSEARDDAIRLTRMVMAQMLADDPEFRYGYQANIACLLRDQGYVTAFETSNAAAEAILELLFGDVG
jgi:hypothetical protein